MYHELRALSTYQQVRPDDARRLPQKMQELGELRGRRVLHVLNGLFNALFQTRCRIFFGMLFVSWTLLLHVLVLAIHPY